MVQVWLAHTGIPLIVLQSSILTLSSMASGVRESCRALFTWLGFRNRTTCITTTDNTVYRYSHHYSSVVDPDPGLFGAIMYRYLLIQNKKYKFYKKIFICTVIHETLSHMKNIFQIINVLTIQNSTVPYKTPLDLEPNKRGPDSQHSRPSLVLGTYSSNLLQYPTRYGILLPLLETQQHS